MRIKHEVPGKQGYSRPPVKVSGTTSAELLPSPGVGKAYKILGIFIRCSADTDIDVYFVPQATGTTTVSGPSATDYVAITKSDRFGLMFEDWYPVGESDEPLEIEVGSGVSFDCMVYYEIVTLRPNAY